ncbi:hypothetical protein [Dyadobacter psychrophilus]|nr:hypothetical protein [Dyadobacter psychrophilus]
MKVFKVTSLALCSGQSPPSIEEKVTGLPLGAKSGGGLRSGDGRGK